MKQDHPYRRLRPLPAGHILFTRRVANARRRASAGLHGSAIHGMSRAGIERATATPYLLQEMTRSRW
jgi:hypothetical protein